MDFESRFSEFRKKMAYVDSSKLNGPLVSNRFKKLAGARPSGPVHHPLIRAIFLRLKVAAAQNAGRRESRALARKSKDRLSGPSLFDVRPR